MRILALLLTTSALLAQPRLTRFADIQGILKSCHNCHAQGRPPGSWPASYSGVTAGIFRAGSFRPLVLPGDAAQSALIAAMEGRTRPHQPKSGEEVRIVRE